MAPKMGGKRFPLSSKKRGGGRGRQRRTEMHNKAGDLARFVMSAEFDELGLKEKRREVKALITAHQKAGVRIPPEAIERIAPYVPAKQAGYFQAIIRSRGK